MKDELRTFIFLLSAACFGTALFAGLKGLPDFGNYQGPYGELIMQTIKDLRHTPQGVAAVTFDYRGFDTLGEEFILFTAVAGGLLLLRKQKRELEKQPHDSSDSFNPPPPNDLVRAAGSIMFPLTLLLGVYVIFHGHLSPGGGFQGGVLLASAFVFVYLSGEYRDMANFLQGHWMDMAEAIGAGSFGVLGVFPLFLEQPFLLNMLPLGESGQLLSAGNLPFCNVAVGIEVAAGFLLLVSSFIDQVLIVRRRG